MLTVRIGRTLQSFPPSKRRGRLSTHAAFQHDGLRPLAWAGTLPKPWARLALSGSPLSTSPRCGFAQSVRDTTPGRPAPCPRHDRPAFGDYAAAVLPTLPTAVPHVRRGHRTRAVCRGWLTGAALL